MGCFSTSGFLLNLLGLKQVNILISILFSLIAFFTFLRRCRICEFMKCLKYYYKCFLGVVKVKAEITQVIKFSVKVRSIYLLLLWSIWIKDDVTFSNQQERVQLKIICFETKYLNNCFSFWPQLCTFMHICNIQYTCMHVHTYIITLIYTEVFVGFFEE